MIEKDFDIPFIADLALREKQIQQNYRPVIAVHKWFARRPGTLFRGLLLSEFSGKPLREVFYKANDLSGRHVADPFMGGGTPILEANRVGLGVIAGLGDHIAGDSTCDVACTGTGGDPLSGGKALDIAHIGPLSDDRSQ